jgi:wobble nucleotide-excising tRNase
LIEQINLKSAATYDEVGATLGNLKKVNFIYGNNGAGKTTISEVIRDENGFPDCQIQWKNNKMVSYVYNRNFVNENFRQSESIKGIFTLGKESVDLHTKIEELKTNIKKNRDDYNEESEKWDKKKREHGELEEEFRMKCWEIKKEVDQEFKELIEGFRNSKEKFMLKCKEAGGYMDLELVPVAELKARKKSLYGSSMDKLTPFQSLQFDIGIETKEIFW